jgi:hypothetical protein
MWSAHATIAEACFLCEGPCKVVTREANSEACNAVQSSREYKDENAACP